MVFDVWTHEDKLVLEYSPDNGAWLEGKLAEPDPVTLRRLFVVDATDRIAADAVQEWRPLDVSSDHLYFLLGNLEGEYFKIDGRKLGLHQAIFLHRELRFSIRQFRAARGVSVFREISVLTSADIYVGGTAGSAIPAREFGRIVAALPTDTELRKYVSARISGIVRNYVDDARDAMSTYVRHRNRGLGRRPTNVVGAVATYEAEKYRLLLDHLTEMLNGEKQYLERDWQVEVKDIVLLLNPQYLKAFREAPIRESGVKTPRSVDFLLVDVEGHVDLLEIKQPFDIAIMTSATYRDNYIPLRELSGTVMQLEKYLFRATRNARLNESCWNDSRERQ